MLRRVLSSVRPQSAMRVFKSKKNPQETGNLDKFVYQQLEETHNFICSAYFHSDIILFLHLPSKASSSKQDAAVIDEYLSQFLSAFHSLPTFIVVLFRSISPTHWHKAQLCRHSVFGKKRCCSVSPTELSPTLLLHGAWSYAPNLYTVRSAPYAGKFSVNLLVPKLLIDWWWNWHLLASIPFERKWK